MDSNQTNNPWFAVSMGLVGLIVGYALANGVNGFSNVVPTPTVANNPVPNAPSAPVPPPSNDTPADVDDDAVLGDEDAEITLIEFTDYQCPFCSRHFTQTVGQIKKDYVDTGKVKYVVRDFPLSFHPNAQKASEASECAADQDKFWEMHDVLFEKQTTWANLPDPVPTFKQFAADLGLNANTFAGCLDGGTHAQEVKDDLAAGSAAGIDGTPGFWILGPDDQSQKISGAFPYDSFKTAFEGMLQ